jgi:hypothetical protein
VAEAVDSEIATDAREEAVQLEGAGEEEVGETKI